MNWNQDKSIVLSLVCVWLFAFVLLASDAAAVVYLTGQLTGAAPFLPETYGGIASDAETPLLTVFWLLFSIPAWIALYELRMILICFRKNRVFEAGTVRHMRIASWACVGAAAVCLAGTFFYPGMFVPALAAAFMALIVRIVKNSFEAAIRMKDELDLTI